MVYSTQLLIRSFAMS